MADRRHEHMQETQESALREQDSIEKVLEEIAKMTTSKGLHELFDTKKTFMGTKNSTDAENVVQELFSFTPQEIDHGLSKNAV